jgi:hypothetical protein
MAYYWRLSLGAISYGAMTVPKNFKGDRRIIGRSAGYNVTSNPMIDVEWQYSHSTFCHAAK